MLAQAGGQGGREEEMVCGLGLMHAWAPRTVCGGKRTINQHSDLHPSTAGQATAASTRKILILLLSHSQIVFRPASKATNN